MRAFLLLVALFLSLTWIGGAWAEGGESEDRQRAAALMSQNKFVETVPILRKLVAVHPEDGRLWSYLGLSLHMLGETLSEPGERKKTSVQAREALLKAKRLGVSNELTEATLAPDGMKVPSGTARERKERM